MSEAWSWLALAGLGAFHGLNPAMGWLFAVALGLHRQSRAMVYVSVLPIALGHALSVGLAAAAFVWAGMIVDMRTLAVGGGAALVGWALYHWRWGHRRRVRVGMRTGLVGLGLWSFLMATAHGAGLMLWPILMPLCFAGTDPRPGPGAVAAAGVAVHTATMLAVTTAVAGLVYEWLGVAILRHTWLNVDTLWMTALALAGVLLILLGAK
jgi:hypothetical protein